MGEVASRGHVVVFGVRGVARRIIRQLSSTRRRILVVDPTATRQEREELEFWDVEYIPGSGQSIESLRAAGVVEAQAVVVATADDLLNIEIALLVRELSKQVRVVVQMANAQVATALRPLVDPGAVFDVAQLATESFIEATLGRSTHALSLGGHDFLVASFPSPRGGTVREIWGDMTPVAVAPASGARIVSCPSRDALVAKDDLVTLLGATEQLLALGAVKDPTRPLRIEQPRRHRIRQTFAAIKEGLDRPFRYVLGILAVLSALSIGILAGAYQEANGQRMSVLDAVYFTAETVATVGFGDFSFRGQDPWLRVWAIIITISGATLIAVATALLTNALVTRSLQVSLGRQRLTRMRGHIVVVGLGQVGSRVALSLREAGYEVAIIDSGAGQRFVAQMEAAGAQVMFGDPTMREVQLAAGVPQAIGLAVVTNDDLVNIEIGLSVRGLVGQRPLPIAVRIFGRNLARVLTAMSEEWKPRSLAELAAPWFIGAALGMEVVGTFYVGSAPYMAARLPIRPGSRFDGILVDDFRINTRVAAIQRASSGALESPPPVNARLHAGDVAYVVGHYQDLFEVLERG